MLDLVLWSVAIGIFLLWLFKGGGTYEFIGLSPLNPESRLVQHMEYLTPEQRESHQDIFEESVQLEEQRTRDEAAVVPEPEPENGRRKSSGQKVCRGILESWFKVPFQESRPTFLRNPETKQKLELDCYNESFRLAVEYNGIQHYKWPNNVSRNKEEFVQQIRRDKFKKSKCDEHGIHLIVVPYDVKNDEIKGYIRERLPNHLLGLAT